MKKESWLNLTSAACLCGAAFLVYARTLAPGLSWRHDGADGGDLLSAAANFGIPHPSGYPTYMLLARLFLLLPFGDEAYRLNLMSACCAAVAITLCYWLMVNTGAREQTWRNRFAALIATSLLAFAPMVWSQATITEVYTLHLCLTAAVFLALQRWRTHPRASYALLVGLLLGLGLGNHLTLAFGVPGIILLSSLAGPLSGGFWRAVCMWLVGLILGLSVYLYLPIASQFGSQLNWGRIESLSAFQAYVGGEIYHGYLFALPIYEAPGRITALFAMLLSEFQVWGVALALVGFVALFRHDRRWALATLTLALGSMIFAVGYHTSDSFHYLMPVWFVCAWWLAVGLRIAFTALAEWRHGQLLTRGFALTLLCLVFGAAVLRFPTLDLSQDHEAERFALQALGALPPQAVLISETDRRTFALWYYTQVRRVRPDVVIVDRDLFAYKPYRDELRTHATNLVVADEGTVESFISINRATHPIYWLDAQSQARQLTDESIYAAAR